MDSDLSSLDKENKIINSMSDSNHKNKLTENEKGTKLLKKGSVLDTYCNSLNESSDFVECEMTNKFRNASQKSEKKEYEIGSQIKEAMMCEICKEDITDLDIHNRGIHVNKCIDNQISSAAEVATQSSTDRVAIESYSNEDVFILDCPLCFKHFSSPELRSNHINKCGKSKGLSLQSILKALELQERHVLERISLGLPTKPVKSVKVPKIPVKKPIVEPKNKAQSDIQLAKALSLSLANSSQQDDAQIGEMVTSVILKPPTANQRPGKKTKKILSSTPLLVLRSDEERKKLLLEKIESILNSAIDSDCSSSSATKMSTTVVIQDIVDEELTLWYLASKSCDKSQYYIEELLDWIKPSDVEMGAKLLHMSQIPGHEIVTQLPLEYTFNTPEENNDTDSQVAKVSSATNQYSSSVIESLSSLIASTWMSDVDIHTACGTVIPAHKIILAIRCPPLKQDLNFCSGKERVSLKWKDVSYYAALQFLNFIYTGNIDVKREMIYDLFYLANKYEVFDLQTVLHSMSADDMPKIESKEEILSIEKELHVPSSSCHIKASVNTENTVCESQEDTNMDLEIVYNCLNHSLKPSQSTNSQSYFLNDTVPLKESPEIKEDNDNLLKSNDEECSSASSCSAKTLVFSPKDHDCTSPALIDVNDSENDADNISLEKAFVYEKFSPKNNGCTSPIIFDVDDSENDNLSDNETMECITNYSQKSAPSPSKIGTESLDLNLVESSNSNDSVKFLQSSYISNKNAYDTPNKTRKSFSPNCSQVTNFSPTIKTSLSYQNENEEKLISFKSSSDTFKNDYIQLKSPSVSSSQVSDEKNCDLTPDKDNIPHRDMCNDLESPVASFSERVFSGFCSAYDNKTLRVIDVDDLKSFSRDSLINKSKDSHKNINSESIQPYQDENEKKLISSESSSYPLKNPYFELKSPSGSFPRVSDEEKYDLTPDKCNIPHRDIYVDTESPVASFSERVLSGFHSAYNSKTLSVTDVDNLKSFSRDSLVNKSNDSCKNIHSFQNKSITGANSVSEDDKETHSRLSNENSPCTSDVFSATKSDDGVMQISPIRNSYSPELLICDSDSDSKSQGNTNYATSPVHHRYMKSSPKTAKPDTSSLANSPFSAHKDSQGDAVFESFHYFDHEISLLNEDQLQTVNGSKYTEEKATSSNKNNIQYPKIKDSKAVVSSIRSSQSSKVSVHREKEETGVSVTPASKSEMLQPKFKISDSPVTPFPDYKNMVTPEIRQALKRIGVKPLPRKKALAILSHVYDETHPLFDAKMNIANSAETSNIQLHKAEKVKKESKKRKQTTQKSEKPVKRMQKESPSKEAVLASIESDDSGSENPEWLGCVPEMSFSQSNHDSPTKPSKNDLESIKLYIQTDDELYHNVLNYIPLNLVEFHQDLKKNGIKISIQKLMDFLDEQCITFTCPRKEEYRKKQTARAQRFRKNMIAKLSQQAN